MLLIKQNESFRWVLREICKSSATNQNNRDAATLNCLENTGNPVWV